MQWLFVPSDNYFTDNVEEIKGQLAEKIPYNDYITLFETIKDVSAGEDIAIDLPEYKISDNFTISQEKFVDFSYITKYRDTWYAWVRGFTFIFMIIYNINQIMKLLRGMNVADGATAIGMHQPNPWAIKGQTSMFDGRGKK